MPGGLSRLGGFSRGVREKRTPTFLEGLVEGLGVRGLILIRSSVPVGGWRAGRFLGLHFQGWVWRPQAR